MADIMNGGNGGRRPPPAWFNPQISLGTILTLTGMAIGGLAVFYEMKSAVAVIQNEVGNIDRRVGTLEVKVDRLQDGGRRPALPFGGQP